MKFHILTIFPKIFDSYLNESIIKRAQKNKVISIKIHNIRDYAIDKHKTVDDRPYGGGPGMILKVEPIYKNLKKIKKNTSTSNKKSTIILLSPRGKTFNQKMALKLSKYQQLVLITGHYEGFDERIKKYVDEEISIGNYILTGGELPAMTIIDAVTRLLPGVLGDANSNKDETFTKNEKYIEYPHYTRPENFKGQRVPKVLLSGNHQKISDWKSAKSKHNT
ncbi:tRNA (guanosine(37)-N1)-methyltransferase TrmD [Patescibacteria group bacterium]|nr:tRNA (guanosine(37)-N1)-methyltransferase TrmD [Patescibacteria group bacterium]